MLKWLRNSSPIDFLALLIQVELPLTSAVELFLKRKRDRFGPLSFFKEFKVISVTIKDGSRSRHLWHSMSIHPLSNLVQHLCGGVRENVAQPEVKYQYTNDTQVSPFASDMCNTISQVSNGLDSIG